MTNHESTEPLPDAPVALVTGASSGFGAATASRLAAQGFRVFGTSRTAQSETRGIEMLALDVDDDASVRACVETLLARAKSVHVLVNNAGRAMAGACEETSATEARSLFETNLFGVMRVVNAVLPTMRARGSGRIVNVGSLSGFISVPFHGVYAATKHALAGYTEALRHEVRPFGVQVSLIEPAAHRTGIRMSRPSHCMSEYDSGRSTVEQIINEQIATGPDPERVVDAIVRAAIGDAPRFRYRVGAKATLAATARWALPQGAFEAFVRSEFRL